MIREMNIHKVNNGWTMEVWGDDGDRDVFIADSRNDLKNLIDRALSDTVRPIRGEEEKAA